MRKIKVRTVDDLQVSQTFANGRVTITVAGTVPTGGWKYPELIDTPDAPADGNHHFDLVAMPPEGESIQVALPVATRRIVQAGSGKFSVVVHAGNNQAGPKSVEVHISIPQKAAMLR